MRSRGSKVLRSLSDEISVWCVYVPKARASDWAVARRIRAWPVSSDCAHHPRRGDRVLFVHDLSSPLGCGDVANVRASEFRGRAKALLEVAVLGALQDTSTRRLSRQPRLAFLEVEYRSGADVGVASLPLEVVEAIRQSVLHGGIPMRVEADRSSSKLPERAAPRTDSDGDLQCGISGVHLALENTGWFKPTRELAIEALSTALQNLDEDPDTLRMLIEKLRGSSKDGYRHEKITTSLTVPDRPDQRSVRQRHKATSRQIWNSRLSAHKRKQGRPGRRTTRAWPSGIWHSAVVIYPDGFQTRPSYLGHNTPMAKLAEACGCYSEAWRSLASPFYGRDVSIVVPGDIRLKPTARCLGESVTVHLSDWY